mmetsp:Transcript_16236/g.32920  ORF Transcript_16236/g.32920 Transcript_16236/m.32920 type:complete len:220 (-) Transcript_16236:422-1081(-)
MRTRKSSTPRRMATNDLSDYQLLLQRRGGSELVELDQFVFGTLPELIRSRSPPHLRREELGTVMRWKLKRGRFRPRLQALVESNAEDAVKLASTAAFQALTRGDGGKPVPLQAAEAAVKELVVLRGVGPATASAVLTAYDPESIVFMSDEALASVPSLRGKKDYSLRSFSKLMEFMVSKREASLRQGPPRSLAEIERDIFTSANSDGQQQSRKRKRVER